MAALPPVPRFEIPDALAFQIFSAFARFEYALKASGMCRANRRFGYAEPNWEKFIAWADVNMTITAGSEVGNAIKFLEQYPPRVQIGPTTWEERPLRGATEAARGIEAARRVRNNLFHGGKHLPQPVPGRDLALVEAALVLLAECVAAHADIGNCFRQ